MKGHGSPNSQHWDWLTSYLTPGTAGRKRSVPSRLLLIEWGVHQARVACYQRTSSRFAHSQSFDFRWTEQDQHLPQAIASALQRELKQRSIDVHECIVAVPRRSVVLKNLELPLTQQASTEELVFLQCESLFPVAKDSLTIDFVQHATVDQSRATVLVAAIPNTVVQLINEVVHLSGLRPLMFGVSELSIPLLDQVDSSVSLDILLDGNRSEFLISQSRLPVISYSGMVPSDPEQKHQHVLSTIQRLNSAAINRKHPLKLNEVNLYGDLTENQSGVIGQMVGIKPKLHAKEIASHYRDQAILTAFVQRQQSIDFLNPRKPADPILQRKRMAVVAIAAAVLLCFAIGIPLNWRHQSLDRQIVAAKQTRMDLEKQVERILPLEATWKKLVAFERSKIDGGEELKQILAFMKSNQQMMLESLEISDVPSSGDHLIKLKGRVNSREVWSSVSDQLLQSNDRYRMHPPLLEPNTADAQYPLRFSVEIELKQSIGAKS